jgi:anti-repressor protein
MGNAIQNYSFESSNVRIIVEDGEPLFCASDVCKALGYANTSKSLSDHCVEKGVTNRYTPTPGGLQSLAYIDERNLYRLVMRSKLPSAEKFQDWVCGEVLPSIRKTGKYATNQLEAPKSYKEAVQQLLCQLEKNEALEAKNLQLENKIEEDAPKVEMAKRAIESDGAWLVRKVAKVLGVTQTFLFDFMHQKKILSPRNEPYAKFVQMGVIRPRISSYPDGYGNMRSKITAYVTARGIEYLIARLLKDGILKDRSCIQYELLNAEG